MQGKYRKRYKTVYPSQLVGLITRIEVYDFTVVHAFLGICMNVKENTIDRMCLLYFCEVSDIHCES